MSKIITVNCEFASELVCVIPYAYWLHQNNQLKGVVTSEGMKPFYYFSDNVEERFEQRTFNINENGLRNVPNDWIHHSSGKDYGFFTEEQQAEANGVLDYSQWTPPPYGKKYESDLFKDLKPYVVISNNYNIEYGNDIREMKRYFNLTVLSNMFYYLQEAGYNVIYKRPTNTEFAPDQNELATLLGGFKFKENTQQGVMSDYDLCGYYDNVYNLKELSQQKNYNEFQMSCFSDAEGFITTNGGGGILCSYFGKKVLFYVPHGKELREGYLTKENSYIKKLSNSDIHVVFDEDRKDNYSELIKQVKNIFK